MPVAARLSTAFSALRPGDLLPWSYGEAEIPAEMWGGEPKQSDLNGMLDGAKQGCQLLREQFPELKIIFGNSGGPGEMLSVALRDGVPAEAIGGLGMERVLNMGSRYFMAPEAEPAPWIIAQIARRYGCQAPPSDCFESGGRGNFGMDPRTAAAYTVRDLLLALAWHFPYIGVGVIDEDIDGYYYTPWGGLALLQRYPALYPRRRTWPWRP